MKKIIIVFILCFIFLSVGCLNNNENTFISSDIEQSFSSENNSKDILSEMEITTIEESTTINAIEYFELLSIEVYSSDVKVFINNYEIANYILQDKPIVKIYDLKNYGFDIINNDNGSISIKLNPDKNFTPSEIKGNNWAETKVISSEVGQNLVAVEIDGDKILCYKINKDLYINFEELSVFGDIQLDEVVEYYKLYINDFPIGDLLKTANEIADYLFEKYYIFNTGVGYIDLTNINDFKKSGAFTTNIYYYADDIIDAKNPPSIYGVTKNDSKEYEHDYEIRIYWWCRINNKSLYHEYYRIRDGLQYTNEQSEIFLQNLINLEYTIAQDLISIMPNKKLKGCFYHSWYTYPNLKVDWHSTSWYEWGNYERTNSSVEGKYYQYTVTEFKFLDKLDFEPAILFISPKN